MHLDWLMHPATFYSAALICLVTSVALFASIKVEMARERSLATVAEVVEDRDHDGVVRGLKAEVEKLRESVSRLEEAGPVRVTPPGPGMNLTKRAQALRMHRRGEPVTSIAAALETPTNEIALMLKVHEMANRDEKKTAVGS